MKVAGIEGMQASAAAVATRSALPLDIAALTESIDRSPAAPAPTVQAPRLALLDVMRVVAALGIVWVHAARSEAGQLLSPIGTFGVPFYTYLAVLFMARGLTRDEGDRRRSLGGYIFSRLYRCYLPFLFWSAIYVGLQEVKGLFDPDYVSLVTWQVIYYGGHEHLWFLPYLMVVTIVGAVLVRALHDRSVAARRVTIGILASIGVAACFWPQPAWIDTRGDDIEFWRCAFRALPTVFFSIALALVTACGGALPKSSVRVAIGGAVLGVAALATMLVEGPLRALRTVAGFGFVLVALLPIHAPVFERIGKLGRYSYGIYLSHLLFVRIVALWMGHFGIRPSLATDVFTFVFAFAAASALSVLLSRSKYTRWTLGE